MEGSTPSGEFIAKKIYSRYGRLGPLARPAGPRPIMVGPACGPLRPANLQSTQAPHIVAEIG
jgi:hypothetical protein